MRGAIAASLFACASAAQAVPFAEATEAIRSNDCRQLGDVVNRHLESSTAVTYLAGAMFEEGICVQRDLQKAARYYAVADERKDAGAAQDMALAYVEGSQLPRSYARAGAWFVKSFALRHGGSALRLPRGLAPLPIGDPTPDAEWAGYLISVAFIGSRSLKYPAEALRAGAEGRFSARVCLADGTVKTTAIEVRPGPSAGVASLQGKREILQAIEANYEKVMQAMPRPTSPPAGPGCFEQPVDFRIR